jgi:hypothetical protein
MGYLHIDNLYKNQTIRLFRECYALEKVHGTSAHIRWSKGALTFYAGGEKHGNFVALFDTAALTEAFQKLGLDEVIVHGEAYGDKQQGMRHTYGDKLCFIAFDVKIDDAWLNVPSMDRLVAGLGLEVVPWRKVSTDLGALDAERDLPSEVAVRRGITEPREREGVILRPLVEMTLNNGERVIVKHKGDKFRETAKPRPVVDADKLAVLTHAQEIADEWVTAERLRHVLGKIGLDGKVADMSMTPVVIAAMVEDIYREGRGEIVESKETRTAIGTSTAKLFKAELSPRLRRD